MTPVCFSMVRMVVVMVSQSTSAVMLSPVVMLTSNKLTAPSFLEVEFVAGNFQDVYRIFGMFTVHMVHEEA